MLKYINDCHLHEEFYEHLEVRFKRDASTKAKAQGLYTACTKFSHLISFSILFNGLEPLKPLVTKLQKRNLDIYKAYHIIDEVVLDLENIRTNIDEEFRRWYDMAEEMTESVGAQVQFPRGSTCFCGTMLSDDDGNLSEREKIEAHFKTKVAIPVMECLISDVKHRMENRNHADIFGLLHP